MDMDAGKHSLRYRGASSLLFGLLFNHYPGGADRPGIPSSSEPLRTVGRRRGPQGWRYLRCEYSGVHRGSRGRGILPGTPIRIAPHASRRGGHEHRHWRPVCRHPGGVERFAPVADCRSIHHDGRPAVPRDSQLGPGATDSRFLCLLQRGLAHRRAALFQGRYSGRTDFGHSSRPKPNSAFERQVSGK